MRRKRTIFIELTSLLDVILIMIFVLLTQARAQTAEAMEDAAADRSALKEVRKELKAEQEAAAQVQESLEVQISGLEDDVAALEEQVDTLGRQVISENLILDNSLVMTVSVAADTAVRLEIRGGETVLIPYDWDDPTYAHNRLRSLLYEQLGFSDGRTVFLVFQYDRTAIYHAEREMILEVIGEIKLSASQEDVLLSFIEMDVRQ